MPLGPLWYRHRIRAFGPFAGLAAPLLIFCVAAVASRLANGTLAGVVWFAGGVAAAPCMLIAGAPFGTSATYMVAVAASVVMWVALGFVASRRATRIPAASWPDFWREMCLLTLGALLGVAGAIVGAAVFGAGALY